MFSRQELSGSSFKNSTGCAEIDSGPNNHSSAPNQIARAESGSFFMRAVPRKKKESETMNLRECFFNLTLFISLLVLLLIFIPVGLLVYLLESVVRGFED